MQYDHILFSNTCLLEKKNRYRNKSTKSQTSERAHNEYIVLETETGQKSEILNPVKHWKETDPEKQNRHY